MATKAKKAYDVVVIGAGNGGLVAACGETGYLRNAG